MSPRVLAASLLVVVSPAAPHAERLALVSFPARRAGFAFTDSGRELFSHDAGRSWQLVRTGVRVSSVDFVSLRIGFGLSASAVLLATTDGGRNWRRVHRFALRPEQITGPVGARIDFVTASVGFVASSATPIWRTDDGGRTWRTLAFRCSNKAYLGGVAFANGRLGFVACGEHAATARQGRTYATTTDGGKTWRRGRRHLESGFVSQLAYPTSSARFVYAERFGISHPEGKVLLATDGDQVTSMSWPSAAIGYALLFRGGLLRTEDGGRHWHRA